MYIISDPVLGFSNVQYLRRISKLESYERSIHGEPNAELQEELSYPGDSSRVLQVKFVLI